jgi:hypothetical protein
VHTSSTDPLGMWRCEYGRASCATCWIHTVDTRPASAGTGGRSRYVGPSVETAAFTCLSSRVPSSDAHKPGVREQVRAEQRPIRAIVQRRRGAPEVRVCAACAAVLRPVGRATRFRGKRLSAGPGSVRGPQLDPVEQRRQAQVEGLLTAEGRRELVRDRCERRKLLRGE